MSPYRARLNTAFGSIEIEFENSEDLQQRLAQAREFATQIASQGSDFISKTDKEGDPYSDLRAVRSDGKTQLLRFPANKGDIVRLAVFLATKSPTMAELVESSGVANPLAYVKKGELVRDAGGRYTLEAKVRQHVVNNVIPSLRKLS